MCARFHGAVRNRRNLPPMPNRSKVLATALLLLTLGHDAMEARAQDPATQDAGIYWLYVHMAPELTTEYAVEVTDRKVLSGYSESAIFPDALLDSVRVTAEALCAAKLGMKVDCIYKLNKKGERITTVGANNELERMPSNTFKGAVASAARHRYIRIDVMMSTGGKAIVLGPDTYSKIKPIVTATIKVDDAAGNEVFKNKVTLKDLSDLRSVERTRGNLVVTRSETLGPEDIFMIYEQALTQLLQ